MRVANYRVRQTSTRVRVIADVEATHRRTELWYEFPAEFMPYLTAEWADVFAAALLLECMFRGEPLHVAGVASATFARNLQYYASAMRMFYPKLRIVDVTFDDERYLDESMAGREMGAGFSGGLDSLCTVYDHFVRAVGESRLDRLVFVNVGSHGHGRGGAELFRKREQRIQEAASLIGLPVLAIDSNLDSFYTMRFEDSHLARTASCVLLFQKLFHSFLVPSTNAYADFGPDGSTPLTDHLLSTDATRIVHDGAQYSRIDKMQRIGDWQVAQKVLNVCMTPTDSAGNCSQCDKCARAMLTFDMLGIRDRFAGVFDFTQYAIVKKRFVARMRKKGVGAPNYYWREIVRHAEAIGYDLYDEGKATGRVTGKPLSFFWSEIVVGGTPAGGPRTAEVLAERTAPRTQIIVSTASTRRPVTAFWYRDKNFGDRLTAQLLRHFGYTPHYATPDTAELVGVGSILHRVPSSFAGCILGTGFLKAEHAREFPRANVLAVRGKLTAERCRAGKRTVLGDPGLLVRNLLPQIPPVRHVLSIVPHYVDHDSPVLQALASKYPKEVVLVDIRGEPQDILRTIAASEYVLSSSLHGLIAADAFGKPNRWLVLSDKVVGDGFKFRDYYSAFDMSRKPLSVQGQESLCELTLSTFSSGSAVSDRAETMHELFATLR